MELEKFFLVIFFSISFFCFCQNDVDYLRYSRTEIGGSPRFVGLGGAMGALGADLSCASYNPSGLSLLTRLDINYGFGFLSNHARTTFAGSQTSFSHFMPLFTSFGLAIPYPSKNKPDIRNIISYSIHQLDNFNSTVEIMHPETKSTLNRDMLIGINRVLQGGNLNGWYEGLGYNTYLLNFDTLGNRFFSFCDTAIPVRMIRKIVEKGRLNESAFSFAQSLGDEWYWGVTLGIQNIRFEHDLVHGESDDQSRMEIVPTSTGVSSSYITPVPYYFVPLYGFKSLKYEEYYKIIGKGVNVKMGIIYRQSPELRLGFYVHSPTYLNLSDEYTYSMETTFDGTSKPMESRFPEQKGVFNYSVVTPWRIGGSVGYIFRKNISFGLDAEGITYSYGRMSSDDAPQVFDGVNQIIKRKYKNTLNFRAGMEYNLFPLFFRMGYVQLGSPFGNMFTGNNVVQYITAGFGFRKKYFYMDFGYMHRMEKHEYYPYFYSNEKARIFSQRSSFLVLLGYKL